MSRVNALYGTPDAGSPHVRFDEGGSRAIQRVGGRHKSPIASVLFFVAAASSLSAGEVVVSSLGRNADDATEIVQKALDSGAGRVVLDRAGSPYIVRPLFVRSNTEVVFEEGVEVLAKRGEFHDKFDSLVTVARSTNVVLRGLGSGATLKMWIKDYQSPAYSRGEWRHVVNLLSAADVTVENLTLADSGGDGVYVGAKPSAMPCRNIAIRRCVCDNNNRQGISVISVDGLLIERTTMKNTRGTNPKAGIDFEPNAACQMLKDVVMRDCLTENNAGGGYYLYAGNFDARTEPISITLENCRSVNDNSAGLLLAFAKSPRGTRPKGGFLVARGCTFSGSRGTGVRISNKPLDTMPVTLENCTIDNRGFKLPSVNLVTGNHLAPPTDGVDFRSVKVIRDDANWISASQMPWSTTRMEGVKGAVELVVDGAKSRTVALDEKWRAAVFSVSGERFALDKVPFDGKTRFRVADKKPGERVALSRIALRFDCEAVVYAAKPGPVTFSTYLKRVSKREMKGGGDFVVRDMSGGKVAKLPAPGERMSDRTFDAPAAGFYRISCHVRPHAVVFGECDAPIGFMSLKDGLDFYKSVGDLWFAHTPRGDATFFCGGTGESASIALYDPDGEVKGSWTDQRDWGFVRIAPEAPKGLWRVHLSRPKGPGYWEDTMLDLTGVPAVFFPSKEKFWVSLF